ncbi:MAG: hypothetical protein H7839_13430 [Magnetococcus sp. YQC-5]
MIRLEISNEPSESLLCWCQNRREDNALNGGGKVERRILVQKSALKQGIGRNGMRQLGWSSKLWQIVSRNLPGKMFSIRF